MRRLVSLGDSFSCGEGVGLRYRPEQIWVRQLADALGLQLHQLARPGTTLAQVRREQVPTALALGPGAVATVLAGPNDLFRTGYDADRLRRDAEAVATALAGAFDLVLLARWHDPLRLYPLPRPVRRRVARRVGDLNAAIERAVRLADGAGPGSTGRVAVLDLTAEPQLADRSAWAIDRVHPGIRGHDLIAELAGRVIAEYGTGPRPGRSAAPDRPVAEDLSRPAECRWWARHGAPWMVRRIGITVRDRASGVRPTPDTRITGPGEADQIGAAAVRSPGLGTDPGPGPGPGQPSPSSGATGHQQVCGAGQVAGSGR